MKAKKIVAVATMAVAGVLMSATAATAASAHVHPNTQCAPLHSCKAL